MTKDFHEVKMSKIHDSSHSPLKRNRNVGSTRVLFKISKMLCGAKFITQNFYYPILLLLLLLTACPLLSLAAPGAPVTNAKEIKKNIIKNKKTLADLKKKLKEEERQQRLTHVKEKNVLNRLQKVDQKLGSLRREKEVNEQDLVETRTRLDRLQEEVKGNQVELGESR